MRRTAKGTPMQVSYDDTGKHATATIGLLPEGWLFADTLELDLCPEGRDELECLMCQLWQEDDISSTEQFLLNVLNAHRESHQFGECEGCSPLQWCPRCKWAATRVTADEMLGSPLTSEQYANVAGVSALYIQVLSEFVALPTTQLELTGEDIETLINSWLLVPSLRAQILNPLYKRAGIFFSFSRDPWGWWTAVVLADQIPQTGQPGYFTENASVPCSFACVRKLEYYRRQLGDDIYTDYLTFRWTNPRLCNLWKIELVGDVRGARASWMCHRDPPPPPNCSGEIVEDASLCPFFGGQTQEFDMVDIPPYPGELFQVWGWLDDIGGDCNPILIASCYYTHFCHTSGEISAIRLMDGEEVVQERLSGSTPDGWIGDDRLRYKAECEGESLTVIPSDFCRYTVGYRVVIYKGGAHYITTKTGDELRSGCQDPDDYATESDLLRFDLCRPFPEHVDGAIIPQKFWGI